jgi:hypothetical protein
MKTKAEETTNRKDTVPGRAIHIDQFVHDGEAIRRKARIERVIGVKRTDFKFWECEVGADGLVRCSSWGKPGSKRGDNRNSGEDKHGTNGACNRAADDKSEE